jgi:hypothetical protein
LSEIYKKIYRLKSGDFIPQICGIGKTGDSICIHDFRKKHTYLVFADLNNYSSVKDLTELELYNTRFGEKIDIVVVIKGGINEDIVKESNLHFIDIKGIEFSLEMLNIYYYPYYILLDKEGLILNDNAPSPGENFEIYFWELLKNKGEVF